MRFVVKFYFYSKIWFKTPQLAAVERKLSLGAFGIKTDVLINFLSNEPPFRNSTTLKIPQSLLCGGSFDELIFLVGGFYKNINAFVLSFPVYPRHSRPAKAGLLFLCAVEFSYAGTC
jgi:hypothetical protein